MPESINKGNKSTAAWLVELAKNDAQEFFRDQFGAPHALVDDEPVPLDGSAHAWLRKLLWNGEHKTAKREDLSAATETLAVFATHGPERTLHTRAAQYTDPETGEQRVYVWASPHSILEVDAHGWRRVMDAPVLFRRVPTLKPLPAPVSGGDLNELGRYIRLKHDRDQRLNIAWVATAYLADIPRPINLATGVQGSAKSTGQRVVKRLLDPAMPEDFKLRRKDFAQNLDNCYVPLFDNAGPIDEDLSDDLCRAVTGSGNADRKLYTDNQSVVRQYKRPILVNGINNPTERGDFMDRALPVEFERIPKTVRRAESELWAEFNAEHPALLGAVLDALSGAIRLRAPLAETPRLADWAEYAAAVYEFMGWGREQFVRDWSAVEEKQHEAALEGSLVAQAIRKLMEDRADHEDTPASLHEELTRVADGMGLNPDRNKAWPKTSGWLWKRIKEALPTLETYGIRAEKYAKGSGRDKRNVILLRAVGKRAPAVDNENLPTASEADTYARGSVAVGRVGKSTKPIPRTKKRLKRGRGTGRRFRESTVSTDRYQPSTIGKPNHAVGNEESTNRTQSTDRTFDDPYLWEQTYIPQLDTIGPRFLTEGMLTPPPSPEYVPQPRAKSIKHEWTIEPDSVCATAIRASGSRSWMKARNLIREIRADWEGYPLPTDAQGWKDLLEHGEGVFFTLEAVEEGLKAA